MVTNLLTDMENPSPKELKDNTIIVVLGASGDLAKKKTVRLIPASWRHRMRC
jgi:glucose-6-phosphate 1-dehydrogenase